LSKKKIKEHETGMKGEMDETNVEKKNNGHDEF
jgi:hypothetical protein